METAIMNESRPIQAINLFATLVCLIGFASVAHAQQANRTIVIQAPSLASATFVVDLNGQEIPARRMSDGAYRITFSQRVGQSYKIRFRGGQSSYQSELLVDRHTAGTLYLNGEARVQTDFICDAGEVLRLHHELGGLTQAMSARRVLASNTCKSLRLIKSLRDAETQGLNEFRRLNETLLSALR
jgi:hypothetical protein